MQCLVVLNQYFEPGQLMLGWLGVTDVQFLGEIDHLCTYRVIADVETHIALRQGLDIMFEGYVVDVRKERE